MKRRELVRHLESEGCHLLREGANHSVFHNPASKKNSSVPRHVEVNEYLARKICKDLEIAPPK
jgi:predicted RNA binding protein YcfA (HicA-like mRNA interferase family)